MNDLLIIKRLAVCAVFLTIFTSCTNLTGSSDVLRKINFAEIDNISTLNLSEYSSGGELIELESTPESLVKKVTDLYVQEDQIIIVDNSIPKICVFDKQGRFVRNIGTVGKGPGEFSGLINTCLSPDGQLIYIHSFNQSRICIYDTQGNHIKDFNTTTIGQFALIDIFDFAGELLVVGLRRNVFPTEDFFQLWFFDKELNLVSKKKPIPTSGFSGYDMQERIRYTKYKEKLYFLDYYDDTVFSINPDAKVEPFLVIDYNRMPTELAQQPNVWEKRSDYNQILEMEFVPPYLCFEYLISNHSMKLISFNIETGKAAQLTSSSCTTIYGDYGFNNDVTGISPFRGSQWFNPNVLARSITRAYINKPSNNDCYINQPGLMKKLNSVFQQEKLGQNDVIELIFLD